MVKGCILPWIHLFGDIRGDYRLCCHIPANDHDRSDVLATHKDSIASIWNNNYYKKTRLQFLDSKIPSPCQKFCYDVEKMGGESNRQQVNKRFSKFSVLQKYTRSDGSLSSNPIYLDFRFNNKCNFKCRICGPYSSSAWFKDADKISVFKNAPKELSTYYSNNDEFWDYLYTIKDSIKYFYFAGGEPLTMDSHYKLLQWLIDNDKTDVELTYNTKLSTLKYKNYNVFKMWDRFEKIILWPSIDGYKKHCEYGRTNFNWDIFERNLNITKMYVSTVSCTISLYSALTSVELILYLKSKGIGTFLSVLDFPEHLDCRLLPKEIKDKIERKFLLLKKKLSVGGNSRLFLSEEEVDNIDRTVAYLKNNIENKDILLKRFKKYNEQVDKLNNTSFVEVYPELKEWYETI